VPVLDVVGGLLRRDDFFLALAQGVPAELRQVLLDGLQQEVDVVGGLLIEDAAEPDEGRHEQGVVRCQPEHGIAVHGREDVGALDEQIADPEVGEEGLLGGLFLLPEDLDLLLDVGRRRWNV
jgi:hypothetical protein